MEKYCIGRHLIGELISIVFQASREFISDLLSGCMRRMVRFRPRRRFLINDDAWSPRNATKPDYSINPQVHCLTVTEPFKGFWNYLILGRNNVLSEILK